MAKTFIEIISFTVKHPIPKRDMPWATGRGYKFFITKEVKALRNAISTSFLAAGGRKPEEGEKPRLFMTIKAEKQRSDGDHYLHAALDAVTKDALKVDDNAWAGSFDFDDDVAENPFEEETLFEIHYRKEQA